MAGLAYVWYSLRKRQDTEDEQRRRRLELRNQPVPQLPPNIAFPGTEVPPTTVPSTPNAPTQSATPGPQVPLARPFPQAPEATQATQATQAAPSPPQAPAPATPHPAAEVQSGPAQRAVLPQISSVEQLVQRSRRISLQCSPLDQIYAKARSFVPLIAPRLGDAATVGPAPTPREPKAEGEQKKEAQERKEQARVAKEEQERIAKAEQEQAAQAEQERIAKEQASAASTEQAGEPETPVSTATSEVVEEIVAPEPLDPALQAAESLLEVLNEMEPRPEAVAGPKLIQPRPRRTQPSRKKKADAPMIL